MQCIQQISVSNILLYQAKQFVLLIYTCSTFPCGHAAVISCFIYDYFRCLAYSKYFFLVTCSWDNKFSGVTCYYPLVLSFLYFINIGLLFRSWQNSIFILQGVLRQVPLVGSLLNWWSPTAKDQVKGRTFNLKSGM